MIYVLGIILVAMVLLAFVVPIILNRTGVVSHSESAHAMLTDQLGEVERDVSRGLISPEDGRSATVEIQRRIIATHRKESPTSASSSSGVWAMVLAAAFVPIAATFLYLSIGSPMIPSIIFADFSGERDVLTKQDALTQRLFLQLSSEENGGETEGWLLLANAYMGMGKYNKAADAYGRILDRDEVTFEEFGQFAEASILHENGIVTPMAERALNRSLQMEPGNIAGIYYKSFALAQSDQLGAAYSLLVSRLARADGIPTWMESFIAQANFYGEKLGKAPILLSNFAPVLKGPTAEDVADASDLSVEDRNAFIYSMVEQLAARLEDEPDDLDGWLQLARAYTVLGDQDQVVLTYRQAEPLIEVLPDSDQRKILVRAVSEAVIDDPDNQSSLPSVIAQLGSRITNTVRYGSAGNVRVEFINDPTADHFEIKITIADGWHVNAHLPLDDYLVPTSLTQDGSAIIDTIYPSGTIKSLSFDEAPLALYEGAFSLRSKKFEGAMVPPRKIMLTFQACSDEVCLPPEDMIFVLW